MRTLRVMTAAIFLFLTVMPGAGLAGSIWQEEVRVDISTGAKTVRTVRVDLSDPGIQILPVMAGGRAGLTGPLSEMASGAGAQAAINGTFFNAYTDKQPQGTLFINGLASHLADGATVGFTEGNDVLMDRLRPEIKGGINGSRQWPNSWYAWNVNSPKTESGAIVVFTPTFAGGVSKAPNSRSVVVSRGVVTGIVAGSAPIPPDGFVIGFGTGSLGDAGRFKVGDRVEYTVSFGPGWEGVKNAISAGPLLVKNGRVVLDYRADGMNDPKITTYSGARSFIGKTWNNILVMGTVPSATVDELAETARALGLEEAVNLDGGASSGLYFDGRYITAPGRELSNCLAVIRTVPVMVNGSRLTGFRPYVAPPGVTMVPVRGVFEKVGAEVSWDNNSQTVTVSMKSAVVKLKVGSAAGTVNGRPAQMVRPAEIKDGRTYIPLRFVAENLGGKVDWDEKTGTVYINIGRE